MKLSLKNSAMLFCLCLMSTLAACSRTVTDVGRPPVAGSSPGPISSSADVVKVLPESISLAADGDAEAKIKLSITKGFHVNANPATFSYLIATQLTAGKIDGITSSAPGYPPSEKKKFKFADQPLAVYEGEVPIRMNLHAEKSAASGPHSLPITILVQACDEEKCFPPATVKSTIELTVK
jgi:thiol:disulfide interchange protein DsbD